MHICIVYFLYAVTLSGEPAPLLCVGGCVPISCYGSSPKYFVLYASCTVFV